MFPAVTVMIITYNRPKEIRRTLNALHERIVYPGRVNWHIADDGSPGSYVRDIIHDYPHDTMSFTITDRKGWGVNANTALKRIATQYVFVCEDDYVARVPIQLSQGVALLDSQQDLGMIRYDGVEGHRLTLELRTCDSLMGPVQYAEILPSSADLYMYSNRPHLIHRRFHDHYGMYPEGLTLGQTEETFAHMVKDNPDRKYGIAILASGIERAFDHIGISYQLTSEDVSAKREG